MPKGAFDWHGITGMVCVKLLLSYKTLKLVSRAIISTTKQEEEHWGYL